MKLNRVVALAVIALLVVGAMGAIGARAFAQTHAAPAAQVQDCAADKTDDTAEAQSAGSDTDNVDLQCGDQNAPDDQEAVSGADIQQVGSQNTSDMGAEVADGAEAEGTDGQEAAPAGTPAITAEAAQKTAEAYLNAGTATRVELDDEDGKLVYSVEFNGTDVKVDAMTGTILTVETGQD